MTVRMTITDLMSAAGLVAAVVVTSRAMRLRMEAKVVVAALRASLQLAFLGYVLLVPIFQNQQPALTFLYLGFVLLIAAREGASRVSYSYGGARLYRHAFAAIGGSAAAVLSYTVLFVLHPKPWWEPQYLIPVAGMVVGNAISAFSLAADRFMSAMKQRSDEVSLRLALGATRFEAALPLIREAVVAGLTPSLNQMSVVGLVSIPGMMTGQILGGQAPGDAARYQLMILFVLMATVR
jgi:putative ABC transport system permease protein